MERLVLKTDVLGLGNANVMHSLVCAADGNLVWSQDGGNDFNFVVNGNIVSKNFGVNGGEMQLANIRANTATFGVLAANVANIVAGNAAAFDVANLVVSNIIVRDNILSANSGSLRVQNIVATGNIDAHVINVDGVDITTKLGTIGKSNTKFFVKTNGSDSSDGRSWDTAFATLSRAAAAAKTNYLANPAPSSGSTILVETGAYLENNPITLPPHVAVVGDNLRRTILAPLNPKLDFFHLDNLCYLYGLRFVNLRRPAFVAAFPCAIAEATLVGGSISNISILYSPTGYTAPPPVLIEAPGSVSNSAVVLANIASGAVTGFTIKTAGSGYLVPPAVTIDPPPSGTRAYATAAISNGAVTSVSLVLGGEGSGYLVAPLVTVDPPPPQTGITATATANVVNGQIVGFTISQVGSGYVERPHISIPPPGKVFVTGSPYVQNCSSISGPFDLAGNVVPVTTPLPYSTATIDQTGGGGGCRVDGFVTAKAGDYVNAVAGYAPTDSPLRSVVADSFTQVNQGGPGHLVINLGYAQFVSCFTTFSSYSFKAVAGGHMNISTSVTDFGKYGLVASGYWPTAFTTATIAQNYRSAVGAVALTSGGAGYGTRSPNVIFDPGESATTAYGTAILESGKVVGVSISNGGGSYLARPNVAFVQNSSIVTLAAPGTVTWQDHGLPANTTVYLATTGALPANLVPSTVYFASNVSTNDLRVSAIPGGPEIAFSAPGTGVHTMYTAANLAGTTVTWPNHGLVANAGIVFSNVAGTLPSNVTANATYYVRASGATTHGFEISQSKGGANIGFGAVPSGLIASFVSTQTARGTASMASPAQIRIVGVTGRQPDYGSVIKFQQQQANVWHTVSGAVANTLGGYDVSLTPSIVSANSGDPAAFYVASLVSTGQHVTEYVGSGVTYNALPEYGGVPDQGNEVLATSPAKVYYTIADQQGNQRIGPFFRVDQLSGTVTLNTDRFNLSGLESIGPFRRDGNPVGVELREVSNDPRLVASTGAVDGTTAPTQTAVKAYVDRRTLPASGTAGYALVKTTDSDFDCAWANLVYASTVGVANGLATLDAAKTLAANVNAANILGIISNTSLPNVIGNTSTTVFFGDGGLLSNIAAGISLTDLDLDFSVASVPANALYGEFTSDVVVAPGSIDCAVDLGGTLPQARLPQTLGNVDTILIAANATIATLMTSNVIVSNVVAAQITASNVFATSTVVSNASVSNVMTYGGAGVKSFSILYLLAAASYTATYRYSSDFYENVAIVSPSQSYSADAQWYTLSHPSLNLIAEQIMDAFTHFLKNRPLGTTHELIVVSSGGDSLGARVLGIKTSGSGGIMYGFNAWTARTLTFTF